MARKPEAALTAALTTVISQGSRANHWPVKPTMIESSHRATVLQNSHADQRGSKHDPSVNPNVHRADAPLLPSAILAITGPIDRVIGAQPIRWLIRTKPLGAKPTPRHLGGAALMKGHQRLARLRVA